MTKMFTGVARALDPASIDADAESPSLCERKVQRMTLTGRKKLYRRGFILAHGSGKDFAAHPGQGNAKDSIRMRMPWNLGFRRIDAINQSQSSELAGFDYVAAKGALLNARERQPHDPFFPLMTHGPHRRLHKPKRLTGRRDFIQPSPHRSS